MKAGAILIACGYVYVALAFGWAGLVAAAAHAALLAAFVRRP